MLSVRRLIWDAWNVAHIARHRVIPEEVEEVCHDKPVTSETYKGRLRVVGLTRSGRILTVILAPTPDADVYYPITARPADRKERRNYQEEHP
jgi:uncharacterized DUF497 family protein